MRTSVGERGNAPMLRHDFRRYHGMASRENVRQRWRDRPLSDISPLAHVLVRVAHCGRGGLSPNIEDYQSTPLRGVRPSSPSVCSQGRGGGGGFVTLNRGL